jgi:hypothetical protein
MAPVPGEDLSSAQKIVRPTHQSRPLVLVEQRERLVVCREDNFSTSGGGGDPAQLIHLLLVEITFLSTQRLGISGVQSIQ